MTPHLNLCRSIILSCTLLTSTLALAERADRDKPIAVEADKVSIDDIKRVQILEGNVTLTQGTLTIRSDRIVITEDQYGFQRGTAFGGPGGLARFRQKKDGVEEWIEGEAERIEYDTHTEIAELFRRAWVKNGEDRLKGDYIWYDSISQRYLAKAGESSSAGKNSTPARVRILIQPKTKDAAPAPADSKPSGIKLKTTDGITLPEHP